MIDPGTFVSSKRLVWGTSVPPEHTELRSADLFRKLLEWILSITKRHQIFISCIPQAGTFVSSTRLVWGTSVPPQHTELRSADFYENHLGLILSITKQIKKCFSSLKVNKFQYENVPLPKIWMKKFEKLEWRQQKIFIRPIPQAGTFVSCTRLVWGTSVPPQHTEPR